MTPERIGLLVADTSRTRAYLSAIGRSGVRPSEAILLGGPSAAGPAVPYFDNLTPAAASLERLGIPTRRVSDGDVNGAEVLDLVRASSADVFVLSAPGGAILRSPILGSGKRFLHVHAGALPAFRGSTTIYYSLLVTGACAATALFLERRLDAGPIVALRHFPAPPDGTTIDHGYDPFIRATLLAEVLAEHAVRGSFPERPQSSDGETFYVMHPVLRHLVILGLDARAVG